MVYPSKTVHGIFYFRFRLVFIKLYIFVKKNNMGYLTLKRHSSFQNKNNRKATHNFPPMAFKVQ